MSLDGEIDSWRDSCMKIGIMTTTKGVLLTKAETPVTPTPNTLRVRPGCATALRAAIWLTHSSAPVRTKAPTIMNMAAMVQGALFDRTPATSLIGRMPSTSISTAPPTATTSTG